MSEKSCVVIEYSPRGKRIVFEGTTKDCIDEAVRLRWDDKDNHGTEAISWCTCSKEDSAKELAS